MADDGSAGAGEDNSDSLPMIPTVTDQEKEIGHMVRLILLCRSSVLSSIVL